MTHVSVCKHPFWMCLLKTVGIAALVGAGIATLVEAFMVRWSTYQKSSTPKHPGNIGGKQLPEEFGVTPLTGYRSWTVVNAGDGTGLALQSLHLGYIWKPGTNTA
ncbi:hypothetical protein LCGC14_2353280, partial [marine sediment metagenome]